MVQYGSQVLNALDETEHKLFHFKVLITAGMGFFTDAYDLWIIGVALLFILPEFNPSPVYVGLLTSSSLFGAFLGPLIFGPLADKFGRRSVYGFEVLILAFGALASAIAPSFIFLVVARAIMGVGIGGDYPTSATIMSEYSNRKNRGRLVAIVFSLQAVGILVGIAMAFGLLALNISPSLIWRIMLGFGALPALSVLYLRRQIPETPRYHISNGNMDEAKAIVQNITGKKLEINEEYRQSISRFSALKKYWVLLLGTAGAWFLFDISYYGTGIFTPLLAQTLGFTGRIAAIEASALIFGLAAVPGYIVAVLLIDKEGRRPIQIIGFITMGILFLLLFLINGPLSVLAPLFLIIYALTFFFSNYGPNITTFVYPTEVFPTKIRTTANGISASMGKLGAAISTLFFPVLLALWGKYDLMAFLGIVAIIGAILTFLILPETKNRSLEETSREASILYKPT
jgi:MFS family permease